MMVLASDGAFAARIAPRRLQSLTTASSQSMSAGSSAVVSTTNVNASTEDGSAQRRRISSRAGSVDITRSPSYGENPLGGASSPPRLYRKTPNLQGEN